MATKVTNQTEQTTEQKLAFIKSVDKTAYIKIRKAIQVAYLNSLQMNAVVDEWE